MEVAKHIHPEINRYRSVLPGLFYTPPPPFEGPDLEIFSKNDLANITKYRGIGQPLAKFLLKEWELRNLDLEPYLKGLYSITCLLYTSRCV